MESLSAFDDIDQIQNYVQQARIPSKALLHSGLFASHFFNSNPDLDPITDLVTTKLFSSKFENPISGQEDRSLVVGLTGSEDGRNRWNVVSQTHFSLAAAAAIKLNQKKGVGRK
jgi:hypothetical protein